MENSNDPNFPQGFNPQDESEDMTIEQRKPGLAQGGAKVIVFGVIMVIFVGYMLNSMFSEGPKKDKVDILAASGKIGDAGKVASGENDVAGGTPSSVPLPPPPKATLPPPPAPEAFEAPPQNSITNPTALEGLSEPPPLPAIGDTPNQNANGGGAFDIPPPPPLEPPAPDIAGFGKSRTPETPEKTQARIHSNMLVIDGQKAGALDSIANPADQSLNQADPNRAFAANVLAATPAQKSIATRLNNLALTIAQGKIINAVLETAVNTDLPGTLRAIVSRDTFAEAGREVLIPKGSRLIGTYNTGVLRGQKRVMVIWTRLIRPDGVDIQIGSAGVDNLGRAGVGGWVDNKYMEVFSAAILTTSMTVGAAVAVDKLVNKGGSSTTSNTDGSTTSDVSPAAAAAANAVTDLSGTSQRIVNDLIDVRPTITIDQGTRVNVFVNRDLTFPNLLEDGAFVQ